MFNLKGIVPALLLSICLSPSLTVLAQDSEFGDSGEVVTQPEVDVAPAPAETVETIPIPTAEEESPIADEAIEEEIPVTYDNKGLDFVSREDAEAEARRNRPPEPRSWPKFTLSTGLLIDRNGNANITGATLDTNKTTSSALLLGRRSVGGGAKFRVSGDRLAGLKLDLVGSSHGDTAAPLLKYIAPSSPKSYRLKSGNGSLSFDRAYDKYSFERNELMDLDWSASRSMGIEGSVTNNKGRKHTNFAFGYKGGVDSLSGKIRPFLVLNGSIARELCEYDALEGIDTCIEGSVAGDIGALRAGASVGAGAFARLNVVSPDAKGKKVKKAEIKAGLNARGEVLIDTDGNTHSDSYVEVIGATVSGF